MSEQKAETVDAFHFGCGTARICLSLIAGTSTSCWQTKKASINSGNHPGEMVPWNFTGQPGWAQVNGRKQVLSAED